MNEKDHLPLFGVGPIYAAAVVLCTLAGVLCRNASLLQSGKITALRIPLLILGIIFVLTGIFIWIQAAVVSKLDDNIVNNRLVTTGIYAWVRNPIYSAFMIICTGVLMMTGNLWLLILPFIYWWFMTALMKRTEEKWLLRQYGQEYEQYCKRVNRCWPWFPGTA